PAPRTSRRAPLDRRRARVTSPSSSLLWSRREQSRTHDLEPNPKPGPAAVTTVVANPAAPVLHRDPTEVEAEPRTTGAVRTAREPLEEPREDVRRNAAALVVHDDRDRVVVLGVRRDPDDATRRPVTEGVVEQVRQDAK